MKEPMILYRLIGLLALTFLCMGHAFPQIKEIRIAPRHSLEHGVSAEECFSSVTYLPLEVKPESLFGNVDQLEVTEDYIFVFDKQVEMSNGKGYGAILIFDKSGKFHAKIRNVNAINFSVDHESKEILISDLGKSRSLNYYNYEGKWLRGENRKFLYTDVAILNSQTKIYYRNFNKLRNTDTIDARFKFSNLILNINGEKSTGYLPYDTAAINNSDILLLHSPFTRSEQSIYFSNPYQFTIHTITSTQLIDKYKFVFPVEFSLPTDFSRSINWRGKRIPYLRLNYNKYCSIGGFYTYNQILFFNLYTLSGAESFIYNTDEDNLISLTSLEFEGIDPFDIGHSKILYVSGKTIYCSLKSEMLQGNKSDIKKKLNIKTKDVNPVLVLLTLK